MNRIAAISETAASTVFYLHTDNVGSTTLVTTANGTAYQKIIYANYGAIYKAWDSGSGSWNSPNSGTLSDIGNYAFTGQEIDGDTGLLYCGARYYDPDIGRFISADSHVDGKGLDTQGYNRYSYARNNPIVYNDPSGHDWLNDLFGGWNKTVEGIIGAVVILAGIISVCSPDFYGSSAVSNSVGSLLITIGYTMLCYAFNDPQAAQIETTPGDIPVGPDPGNNGPGGGGGDNNGGNNNGNGGNGNGGYPIPGIGGMGYPGDTTTDPTTVNGNINNADPNNPNSTAGTSGVTYNNDISWQNWYNPSFNYTAGGTSPNLTTTGDIIYDYNGLQTYVNNQTQAPEPWFNVGDTSAAGFSDMVGPGYYILTRDIGGGVFDTFGLTDPVHSASLLVYTNYDGTTNFLADELMPSNGMIVWGDGYYLKTFSGVFNINDSNYNNFYNEMYKYNFTVYGPMNTGNGNYGPNLVDEMSNNLNNWGHPAYWFLGGQNCNNLSEYQYNTLFPGSIWPKIPGAVGQ